MAQWISLLVEGEIDEAVGRRIVEAGGLEVAGVYGKRGIAYIRRNLRGFDSSSAGNPILVLVDLMDTGLECGPRVVLGWLSGPSRNTLLRAVVPEIESWVMADRAGLARFLGVRRQTVPLRPEALEDPKSTLIALVRRSRYRRIREAMVPQANSTARVGPAYNLEICRFVRDLWNLEAACGASDSLTRCVRAVEEFASR
jgi:hypothetical protein